MIKEHLLYVFPRFDEDGKKGLPIIGPFRDAKEKVNILKQVFTLNGNAFKCTTMRLRVPSVRISGCAMPTLSPISEVHKEVADLKASGQVLTGTTLYSEETTDPDGVVDGHLVKKELILNLSGDFQEDLSLDEVREAFPEVKEVFRGGSCFRVYCRDRRQRDAFLKENFTIGDQKVSVRQYRTRPPIKALFSDLRAVIIKLLENYVDQDKVVPGLIPLYPVAPFQSLNIDECVI